MRTKKVLFIIFQITLLSFIQSAVDFKKFETDSSLSDVVFCGPRTKEIIIALSDLQTVYRSEDKGFTWHLLSEEMHTSGKKELEENEHEVGKVSSLILSPVDNNIVIFLGTHGINWVSQDCGKTVRALNHGRKIQEYHFHPTERNWGLASAYTICEDFKEGEPCHHYKELFVTKDLGENWELIKSYVVQFAWGALNHFHIFRGVPKERILVTYEPRGKGNQKIAGWNYKVDLISSDNFFKSYRVEVYKGNKFMITPHYLFVAQAFDTSTQESRLLVSESWLQRYDFKELDLSFNKFKEHSYSFLDTSEASVFINVNHFGENSNYGHIYTSDWKGIKYSPSLKYNIRDPTGYCEFDKVHSLYGTFIANTYDKSVIEEHLQEIQTEAIEEENSIEDKKKDSKNGKHEAHTATKDLRSYVTTNISFNKGGKWHPLKAPERDSQGKKYDCGEYCYLHLANTGTKFPTYYSVEKAVGIILGNGNVGKYFSEDEEEIATFLSRDGGLTWAEIKKGSHIYEIGDHGALLVMAEDQVKTRSIHYSWDEGLTWQELVISEEKVLIKNILTEPLSTSLQFIVYGESETKKGKKSGFIVGVNFASLNQPTCRNPQDPDTANSDYEKWIPKDSAGEHSCHLGIKTFYTRRKREAQCFNPLGWEVRHFTEFCACTDDDYECDVGYERVTNDSPCTAIHSISEEEKNKPPLICHGHYEISRGYRKIPGSGCRGGIQNDPILIPCPSNFFNIFSLLLIIVFVGATLYFLYNFSDVILAGYIVPLLAWLKPGNGNDLPKYKPTSLENTINFPEDDNVLFDDKEEQMHEVSEQSKQKKVDVEVNQDDNEIILPAKPLKKLTR